MDPNGSKWIQMDLNGSQWITMDHNESQWFPMDPRVAKILKLKGKASVKSLREQSFQVAGPRLFNCVPKDIRNMSNCGLEDFKLKLDQFLTKVPDEPKGEGLIPGATNPFTGRQTNSLIHQVTRRVSSWNCHV